jgi:YbbR domain-containing protein
MRARFWDTLGSVALAFGLAVAVWVASVNAQDHISTASFPGGVPIEYVGLGDGLLVVNEVPQSGEMTLRAPQSGWDRLSASGQGAARLVVDLTGLQAGEHSVAVKPELATRLAQVMSFSPEIVNVNLENSLQQTVPISVVLSGEPVVGFRADNPQVTPSTGTVQGPASAVGKVQALQTVLDVSGRSQDIRLSVTPTPVDSSGRVVSGVQVSPANVSVFVPIVQRTGYRTVAVVPVTEGQVAPGYRVTNITVSPTLVTLRSPDPQAVDLLPGYVQTEPVNLDGVEETVERQVLLSIPQGFSLVGEQSVLVQVSIEPIETSITISRQLELQGLETGITAQAFPASVQVILTGPLPTLDQLRPEDVRVVLNLFGLGLGTHQVTPEALDLPRGVKVQTFLPETIEVQISQAPGETPTPAAP